MPRSTFPRRSLPTRLILAAVVAACSSGDHATAPRNGPEFAISDAAHEGGIPGFFFLPPMVVQPTPSGTSDADIATLNPQIAICDVTSSPDANCGSSTAGATPAVVVITTTSTQPITLDLATLQYQANWDTQGASFVVGHTYRLHVTAGAPSARRELGFADVLLTTTPGQAKPLATADLIVLRDGRTLPIHFRIEAGIPGSLAANAATASVTAGGTDQITATLGDLHATPLVGATVAWSVMTTPSTGVADAIHPLDPTSGNTATDGTTTTTFGAGATPGTAAVVASSAGLRATANVTVRSAPVQDACEPNETSDHPCNLGDVPEGERVTRSFNFDSDVDHDWFSVRALEASSSPCPPAFPPPPDALMLSVSLTVPAGEDYDLYVTIGGLQTSSQNGVGQNEAVDLPLPGVVGAQDSWNGLIEVRNQSGRPTPAGHSYLLAVGLERKCS